MTILGRQLTMIVTGATGFLGSHLVKLLLEEGYQVIVLKRSFSNQSRIVDVAERLVCYDLDQCDLSQPFRDFEKIDAVIHTATCYGKKGESASAVMAANLSFPLQLLELAVNWQVPLFLNTDTYSNRQSSPYQVLANYSLSKQQFSDWGKLFANKKLIRFVNIRLEHLFGEEDSEHKFTNWVIGSCLQNVKELKLTLGAQKRDFIYIRDAVAAYSVLLRQVQQSRGFYQEYELGSGRAISVREFVETVHSLTNSQTILRFGAIPLPEYETMHSEANISDLKALGWSPQYNLEQALCQILASEEQIVHR